MPLSHARQLIVTYAGALALTNLWTLPHGGGDFGLARWVMVGAFQAVIVWGLWGGSQIAWLLGVTLPLLGVVSLALFEVGGDVGLILLLALLLAQVAILCTLPLLSFVWSKPASAKVS